MSVLERLADTVEARKRANALKEIHKKAQAYCDAVLPFFEEIRYHSDRIEGLVSDEFWPLARYRELLFVK